MQYQVTEIQFDFEEITLEDQNDITSEVIGTIWEAIDDEDLIDEITTATGWCILSIDYRVVLV
jgi:hypothetical protein|tara:strand:- start:148 stop:336 length:189 start_codon:yes stop_codon:yes gene_type:complete